MEGRAKMAIVYRQLAEQCRAENKLGNCLDFYLISLQLKPEWKNELRSIFSSVLCSYGRLLEHGERIDELFNTYEKALTLFPENEVILNNLGAHLYRLEQSKEAFIYFKNALIVNQSYLPAFRNLEIAKSHLVERWHFRMLNDSLRNKSYESSIYKKVHSNFKSVLDIGTGTGILSIYAKKAGAVNVYSCDYSSTMISIATKVLDSNLLTDSIILINKLSNELVIPGDIPERLSMAVTETFDAGLLGEGILQTLIHAWENLLQPKIMEDGQPVLRVIPEKANLYITPVECLHIARKHCLINSKRVERSSFIDGLNLSELCWHYLSEEPYDTENLKNINFNPLGSTEKIFEFDFNNILGLKQFINGEKDKNIMVKINNEGFVDAFVVWFDLILDSCNAITSSPLSKNHSCWEQAVFPIKNECYVNDSVSISAFASCKDGILSIDPKLGIRNESKPEGLTQPVICALNCESLLLNYIAISNYVKTVYQFDKKISVLDLSWFPYLGLLISKYCNSTVYASSKHMESFPSIDDFLVRNEIEGEKVILKNWRGVMELLENNSDKYDVIIIDALTPSGELDEEVLSLIPSLRNVLEPNGLFLPMKWTICSQLIFSEDLANLTQMSEKKNEFNIAQFLNEFKVSHMVDFNRDELKYEEMSPCFEMAVLDLNNIVNNTFILENEIVAPKDGKVNAVLYWFTINYNSEIQFSTICSDSHINQSAFLFDRVLSVEANSRLRIHYHYNSGAMKFVVL